MININGNERYKNIIQKVIETGLEKHLVPTNEVEINVSLVSATQIKEINNQTRGIDEVTDVLSFPAIEFKKPFKKDDYRMDISPETNCVMLGDILICIEKAKSQAKEYNHSLTREIAFLAVHALLHLLGYDHVKDEEQAVMQKQQDEILNSLNITREQADDVEMFDLCEQSFKVGKVALVGRPNAGKSTLINALVGEKVAIVSWKPQTTRNRILGVMNTSSAQIIFLDTPGIHVPKNALGKFMMRSLTSALESVDTLVYLVDGEKGANQSDLDNINRYICQGKKSVIVAINKVDHITKERVFEIISFLSAIKDVTAIVPISALKSRNLDALTGEIVKLLPYGEPLFDEETYTDSSMRFMASEIIREKALRLLDEEIPFGIGVNINKFEEKDNGVTVIDAEIICQKATHKPIILGKNGAMIKRISTYSRQDLEAMVGSKVYLTLWVKIKEDWRDDFGILKELGYNKPVD